MPCLPSPRRGSGSPMPSRVPTSRDDTASRTARVPRSSRTQAPRPSEAPPPYYETSPLDDTVYTAAATFAAYTDGNHSAGPSCPSATFSHDENLSFRPLEKVKRPDLSIWDKECRSHLATMDTEGERLVTLQARLTNPDAISLHSQLIDLRNIERKHKATIDEAANSLQNTPIAARNEGFTRAMMKTIFDEEGTNQATKVRLWKVWDLSDPRELATSPSGHYVG